MPERIQLSRQKGWRKPENTVTVSRPGKWGNPFHTLKSGIKVNRGYAVSIYRLWITRQLISGLAAQFQGCDPMSEPPTIEEIREMLAGKNLACWCPLDDFCHADVLLELANQEGEES